MEVNDKNAAAAVYPTTNYDIYSCTPYACVKEYYEVHVISISKATENQTETDIERVDVRILVNMNFLMMLFEGILSSPPIVLSQVLCLITKYSEKFTTHRK